MIRVFPVAGRSQFADTWGAARSQGREHQGTDIFAPLGTPVVAVNDGQARKGLDPLGGNVATLTDADARYYYAHLDDWEGEFPRKVKVGDVLGYVGTTGNAQGLTPHLHFGVYVANEAVNPFPELQEAKGATVDAPRKPSTGAVWLLAIGALVLWKGRR
jgi:murein DD-endopeptidase MepM/ murein hydrolase activator NlpD